MAGVSTDPTASPTTRFDDRALVRQLKAIETAYHAGKIPTAGVHLKAIERRLTDGEAKLYPRKAAS